MTLAIAAVLGAGGVAEAQMPTAPNDGAPVPTTTTAISTTTTAPPPGIAPVPVAPAPPPAPVVTTSAEVDADPAPPATGAGETSTTTSYVNRPLLVSGLILFGGTYGASAIDVATSSRQVDKNNLPYPVVGPWMDYGKRGGCPQEGSCGRETGNKVLLILDGVGQGIGAISVISSFFISEKTTRSWWLIGDGRSFQAAPTTVGTGYGLGAVGSF
jgi:hypothetical protein